MSQFAGTDHLHKHVYRTIADEIAIGALKPGDRLPAERELCTRLGVSRATVRRAIRMLANEGLVEAFIGRGTYVRSKEPLSEPPNALMSFSELAAASGLVATARVLEAHVRRADLDEAERFTIAPGSNLFVLERLRLLDGSPISIDHNRIPLARAPQLQDADFATGSLYKTLDESGITPVRVDCAVEAIPADQRSAGLLDVAVGTPLLRNTMAGYDSAGRLIELSQIAFRGDRYRFRATLSRRRGSR